MSNTPTPAEELLYQVAKITAENDSIYEGYGYHGDYSREDFKNDTKEDEYNHYSQAKAIVELFKKELATAHAVGRAEGYKRGLDDMFIEIAHLAEPDERQFNAGDLKTNMDFIHEIRTKLDSADSTGEGEYGKQ